MNDPSLGPPSGARAVLVDGPFDPGHDDPPNWTVSYLDDDGEDAWPTVGRTTDQSEAQRWGRDLARHYRLELIDESDAA